MTDLSAATQADAAPFRILLVEDDARLAGLISEYLAKHDINVLHEARGDSVMAHMDASPPALVILDLMLPGLDGFEVCRQIRARHPGLPVIMLTARDEDFDRVLGLELGADNYLQKPIEPRVLLAHVRALMRRVELRTAPVPPQGSGERLTFGRLTIDRGARRVTLAGQAIDLSTSEFDLLWLLAQHAGKVLSRDAILQKVRNLEYDGVNRSVDYRVFRLRKKLGDIDGAQERIKTVRGAGYFFAAMDW